MRWGRFERVVDSETFKFGWIIFRWITHHSSFASEPCQCFFYHGCQIRPHRPDIVAKDSGDQKHGFKDENRSKRECCHKSQCLRPPNALSSSFKKSSGIPQNRPARISSDARTASGHNVQSSLTIQSLSNDRRSS